MKSRADRSKRAASLVRQAERLEDDGLPELSSLIMGGRFVDDLTAVARSNTEMFLGTGRFEHDRSQVLVPFVEMTMLGVRQGDIGEAGAEPTLAPVFQRTMTLENALWLAFVIMRDIRQECATLNKIAKGEIPLDPSRMAHARFFAEMAREQADLCVALCDELGLEPNGTVEETGEDKSVTPRQHAIRKPHRRAKKAS